MAARRLRVPHHVRTKPPAPRTASTLLVALVIAGVAAAIAALGVPSDPPALAGTLGVLALVCLGASLGLFAVGHRSRLRYVLFDHDEVVLRWTFTAERIPARELAAIRFHAAERPPPEDPHLHHGLLIETTGGATHLLCEPDFVDDLDSLIPDLIRHYHLPDTYERSRTAIPHHLFGPGSDRPFADYFTGSTTTTTSSVEEILDWLATCEFVHDHDRFDTDDHWQHPLEFEANRAGDCEDHALWAWRRLVELGYEAEFVCGHRQRHPSGWDVHAWVTFDADDSSYLLEAVSKQPVMALVPMGEVGLRYIPHYAVNERFETTHYPANILGDDRYHRDRY